MTVKIEAVNTKLGDVAVATFGGLDTDSHSFFDMSSTGDSVILSGSSKTILFSGKTSAKSTNYSVGLYNKKTNSLKLQSAPRFAVEGVVKRKRRAEEADEEKQHASSKKSYMDKKIALGEAFGNRKQKKAILDVEKNRIDAEKLEDNELAIVDSVNEATANMAKEREANKREIEENRPIPKYNATTHNVEEIYPLDSIVSLGELDCMDVSGLLAIAGEDARLKDLEENWLGSFDSDMIASRISGITSTEQMRILIYLALLNIVFSQRRAHKLKEKLIGELPNVPPFLITGILERYAILRPGSKHNYRFDTMGETKILCAMMALLLRLDGYVTYISPLSKEFSLKNSQVAELFKALGCSVRKANQGDKAKWGITADTAAMFAVLKAPLKLPSTTKGSGRR